MQELEIKILNVDVDKIKKKLDSLNAVYKDEVIQKIYTYDCYDPIIMYELAINDYKITNSINSLKKIINVLKQIKPVISNDEKELIKMITGYEYLDLYISNNLFNIDINILEKQKIKSIIRNSKERFFKWIRLRQSGEKVEFTIKYIYNVEKEYNIDDVKEIEINVSDFEIANKIIEEMGYFRKKLVEKKRTSYELSGNKIEIDVWPLIPPYIEIEGSNVDSIYDIAKKLGYSKDKTCIMNTEDIYLDNGINLNDYEILTFKEFYKYKN